VNAEATVAAQPRADRKWIREADGVFRGGGVKGIALAGALEGFAKHPEKPIDSWVNVAGSSAGAIIAAYLALGHSAEEMVALLTEVNFGEFADFPGGSKLLGVASLFRRHGMARGKFFESWFDEVLDGAMFERVKADPEPGMGPDWRLKMVAVDVTNRRLLVLPNDLAGYRDPKGSAPIDPDKFKISKAARISMSIPYFFEPVELIDPAGKPAVLIDGGTLSNFPVWIFDIDPAQANRPPRRPTFGFTLKGGKGFGANVGHLPWPLRFGVEIFRTAQDAWDERFVSRSTRVRTLAIDAGDVATTDFDLGHEKAGGAAGQRQERRQIVPRRVRPGPVPERLRRGGRSASRLAARLSRI
jgi:NTE family protein